MKNEGTHGGFIVTKRMFLSLIVISTLAFGQVETSGMELFVGSWSGEGGFANVNFNKEVGALHFELQINDQYTITGRVGDAELYDAELSVDDWNDGFMIQAKLRGKIFPDHEFKKRRVIFLFEPPLNGSISGDFHLKSNYTFDLFMRQGGLTLHLNP